MKKIFFALVAAVTLFAGCTKDLEQKVADLEKKVETISELQTIIDNLNNKVYVSNYVELEDNAGYKIEFTNGESITLKHGEDGAPGEAGDDGDSWFKGVDLSEDGKYVVITLNDEKETEYQLPLYNANATTDEFNIEFEKISFENVFEGDKVEIPFEIVGEVAAEDVEIRVYPADPSWTVEVLANALKVTVGDGQKCRIDVWAWNNATLAAKEVRAKTLDFSTGVLRVSNTDDKELTAAEQSFLVPVMYYTENVYVDYTDLEGNVLSGEGKWFYTSEAISTKAFTSRDLPIIVTKNYTGVERAGYLEFRTAADQEEPLYKIKLTQGTCESSLLEVNWVESFGLYESADPTEAVESYSNKSFTISLGTDPTKGLYVLEGILFHQGNFNINNQSYSAKGGKYYADLEGTTLKVYLDNATDENGYHSYSPEVWEMTYDKEAKTLTASDITLKNWGGTPLTLKGWTASEKQVATVTTPDGSWTGTCQYKGWNGNTYNEGSVSVEITPDGSDYKAAFTLPSASFTLNGTWAENTLTLSGNVYGENINISFILNDQQQLVSSGEMAVSWTGYYKDIVLSK